MKTPEQLKGAIRNMAAKKKTASPGGAADVFV